MGKTTEDDDAERGSTLWEVLDDLAHGRQSAGGGGAAAAVAAAAAAAAVAMAARASRPGWNDAGGAIALAETQRACLHAMAERDAAAYGKARALLLRTGRDRDHRGVAVAPRALAQTSAEQRERELADALTLAAVEPLRIAEAAAEVAQTAAWVANEGAADHRPDAIAAACLAEGAARAAAQLVEINMGLRPDDELAARARAASEAAAQARRQALGEA